MMYKNIVAKKTYIHNNEEKTKWLPLGVLKILDNGKMFVELNHMPDVSIYVFDPREKEESF